MDEELKTAIEVGDLSYALLQEAPVLVRSLRKGYLRVRREGDEVTVENPWLAGSSTFRVAADGQAATAAYWKGADGRLVASPDVHPGHFIDNVLPTPFFDFAIARPGAGRDVADYDARN